MGKRVWYGLHAEEVADRTFVMAIDSTTLTNDKLYIDVTITASGTDVATERLSVELYNQSGSAVVGQHYNDGISQLVRFDPTTCQAVLDAAGNPTYTVRMTARDLVVYACQASPPSVCVAVLALT
ncbi:hypothetical protein [Aeromonas caviae]|jgi:hypothetical protein|uniref:hypothetical protein n=2 Tax=Aeromonadaceae TaxID=84642 RepID=UPI0029D65D71|nr:hypothetical protein [Aeromonas caviae]MDX7718282.1 hypothetical protein [Aeromonas caviae]